MARRVTPPLAVEDTDTLDLHLNGGVISGDLASGAVGPHEHDAAYVNVTGDTMTGSLVIAGNLTAVAGTFDEGVVINDGEHYSNTIIRGANDHTLLVVDAGTGVVSTDYGMVINSQGHYSDTIINGANEDNVLVVDADTDRVGIGTASPSQKLHVAGNALISSLSGSGVRMVTTDASGVLGSTALPVVTVPGGANTQVQFNDSGAFGGDPGLTYNWSTNALTLTGDFLGQLGIFGYGLTINAGAHFSNTRIGGNTNPNMFVVDATNDRIGIGTASPSQMLHVVGGTLISALAGTGTRVVTASSTGVLGAAGTGSADTQVIFNDGGALVGDPGLTYDLATDKLTVAGAGVFGWGLSINEGAHFSDTRIKSNSDPDLFVADATNNRVGIGTASPSTKLHVLGNTLITDLAGTGTRMVTASSTGLLATQALPSSSFAGADTQVIFNDGGAYAGDSGLTYAKSTDTLTAGTHTALVLKASGTTPNLFLDETDATTDEKFWRLAPNGGDLWLETVSDSFGITRTVLRFARTGTLVTNVVFNDAQADTDFQVKGDADDNTLYVDASTDRVGIGTAIPAEKLEVNGAIQLSTTNKIQFYNNTYYLRAFSGLEINAFDFVRMLVAGNELVKVSPTLITLNSGGTDLDTQIKGDIDPNLLYTDASTDRVGIGTATPAVKLDVVGGGAFTADVTVPDEAYGSGWDGSLEVPTKNALYDKIQTVVGGGGGTPGGSTTQVQFNDAGAFGGDAGLTYNKTTDALTVAGGDPLYLLRETDAAANEKVWALTSTSGILALQLKDDAETTATNILRVHRVGYNPDYLQVETQLVANTGMIANQSGGDWDFQVKGDIDPNLLYTDASTDRVGIGTNLPSSKLHVTGAATLTNNGTNGLNLQGGAAGGSFDLTFASNTTYSARIAVPGATDSYSTGATAGDLVIRTENKTILFNTNGGSGAVMTLSNSGVKVVGAAGSGTRPAGFDSAGLLAPLAYGTTSGTVAEGNHTHTGTFTLAIPIGDGTNVIPTGVYTDFQMPVAGIFVAWRILGTKFTSGSTGSVVFDLWKSAYSAFPPVVGGSISTSKPTLTTAVKAEDTTITDWTEAFSAGDCFRLNVDSAALCTLCTLILEYTRSV